MQADIGEAFTAAVLDAAAREGSAREDGARADGSSRPTTSDRSALSPGAVAGLVERFGLASTREAALLALPAAATLARPHISDYHVGAVGVTGDGGIILGGNLEFPGASIHHTVHAEGFVTLRALALGEPLAELAVRQARPCAHCRQVLAELSWADTLRIVDPLGADVTLSDLYPVAFLPSDLDTTPATPGLEEWPAIALDPARQDELPPDVVDGLVRAGRRAHAPYSAEPAAVVLALADGRLASGACLESVAFNPTMGPLQDALVMLAASSVAYVDIRTAWLATVDGARVDHAGPTRDLLRAVAPDAELHVLAWA